MNKWIDYKPGNYEKKFYDIRTMGGNTFYGCWPNAGSFNLCNDKNESIDEHFVLKIRASRLKDNGMPVRSEK